MIRHISLFFIKEKKKNEKESLKKALEACTKKVGADAYVVGEDYMERPVRHMQGMPEFGDFIQIIDFPDEKNASEYPNHPAHLELMEKIGDAIEKVAAIDIRM